MDNQNPEAMTNSLFYSNDIKLTQPPDFSSRQAQQMRESNEFVEMPPSGERVVFDGTDTVPFYQSTVASLVPSSGFANAVFPTPVFSGVQSQMAQIQKALDDPKLAPVARALLDAMGMTSPGSWSHQTPVSAPAAASWAESNASADWSDSADLNGEGKRSYTRSFASATGKSTKRRRDSANLLTEGLEDLKDEDTLMVLQALCDDDENEVPLERDQMLLSPSVCNAMGTLSVNDQASPCLSATEGGIVLPPPAVVPNPASKRATIGHQNKKRNAEIRRKRSPGTSKKSNSSSKSDSSPSISPQQYLNKLLTERGYSTSRCCSFDAGYLIKPSPLQLASFGTKLVGAIRTPNVELLSSLLSCGLSRNPCNDFGDSIINLVCKRGDASLFRCLVQSGCEVRVADEWGRTPLHYAAWAGRLCFDSIGLMLHQDVNLLRVLDKKGMSPLEYVTKDKWAAWIHFLQNNKDAYWPVGGNNDWNDQVPKIHRPGGTLPDPDDALSVDLAKLVASGGIAPEVVLKGVGGLGGWKLEAPNSDDARRRYMPVARGA